jgi:hypothetical protein
MKKATPAKEKKARLLKAKIAVVLQDEYNRVPTEEEINAYYHMTRIMWKTVIGLHYKRREMEKTGQLALF